MKNSYLLNTLAVLLMSGFFSCKNDSNGPLDVDVPIRVQTAMVKKQDIKEYLVFDGVTRYQKKEDVRANVTGYISWMPYEIGDLVKKGQAFASIRTKEQDALSEAVKIDSSLSKFTKPMTVRNNASGVISKLNVVTNDYVAEGDRLATISQPNTLVVQVNVPFEYTNLVKVGTPCEIIINGHEKIDAEISSVLTSIDSLGQSQHYLVKLQNQNIPENLNVQVKIVSAEAKNALTIPQEALQTNELITNFWVMKLVNDTLAIKKGVEPLLQNDSIVQIRADDIQPNDRVITDGAYQMKDSTRVSVNKQ
ncbi:hypothetical protein C7S20_07195 [Christiangramia fulva]|uniref:RND transporter n=1 Tax=Christiangramia fulva TaxID=2126553 RepID=A0A2R3Z484_9FLAO|nr:HlyD family efflux transporter periplasmic adaptor subunit [Christiangramia fulva]AVR45071.1 hypothetical protein C7S20_07195 [Christiangramia fulva]